MVLWISLAYKWRKHIIKIAWISSDCEFVTHLCVSGKIYYINLLNQNNLTVSIIYSIHIKFNHFKFNSKIISYEISFCFIFLYIEFIIWMELYTISYRLMNFYFFLKKLSFARIMVQTFYNTMSFLATVSAIKLALLLQWLDWIFLKLWANRTMSEIRL